MTRIQGFLLAAVALLVGVIATASLNIFRLREQSTVTFRRGIMSTEAELIDDCKPFPFTATHHPTQMIEIELPGTFDPKNLQVKMTQMNIINASPWTNPDPGSRSPIGSVTNWTPKTKLDMDLDLGPQGGPKRTMVLIKVIVRDPAVTFRDRRIRHHDGRRQRSEDVLQVSRWIPAEGGHLRRVLLQGDAQQADDGRYGLGLVFQDIDPGYILPIFVDPEVQNNGID